MAMIPMKDFEKIRAEFAVSDDGRLGPVYGKFNAAYSFETLKLVRLFM